MSDLDDYEDYKKALEHVELRLDVLEKKIDEILKWAERGRGWAIITRYILSFIAAVGMAWAAIKGFGK